MRAAIVIVVLGIGMWALALDRVGSDETDGPSSTGTSLAVDRPGPATSPTTDDAAVDPADAAGENGEIADDPDGAPTPEPTATPTPTPTPAPDGDGEVHVVVAGDTMARIAQRYNVSLGALVAANPHIEDPTRIEIGDRISIPD